MVPYVIQSGDNPSSIARRFGMTLLEFQAANPGLCDYGTHNCRVLFPGQVVQVARAGGISSSQTPAATVTYAPPAEFNAPPPWMQIAIMEVGVQEWSGARDNPRILEYLASAGIAGSLLKDETAWCAAFAYWCLWKSGYPGRRSARVADWHGWGRAVVPAYGAVCILQPLTTDQASSGHMGFLHAMDETNVWLLSGNSANQVRISAYPKAKLHPGSPFRWPV